MHVQMCANYLIRYYAILNMIVNLLPLPYQGKLIFFWEKIRVLCERGPCLNERVFFNSFIFWKF